MVEHYSIRTYANWTSYFPFVVALIILFFSIANSVFVHPILTHRRHYEHYINFFFMYSKVIFRDALKRKKDPHRILLHRYEIAQKHVVQLSTVTSAVIYAVFISFWASFLVDQTFVCDPQLDCFISNSSTEVDANSAERVDDCADVSDNVTVICYHFVLDTTAGFASAVGFLTVAVFLHLNIWTHADLANGGGVFS